MFKLGVITDEISQDFVRAVELAIKNRLDFIDIRTIWNKSVHELTEEEILRIKKIINNTQLKVICIATPVFKCDIENANEYRFHLDILKKCIEVAHSVESNIIRIFTFWRNEDKTLEKYWNLLLDRYMPVVELAEKEKIKLAVENEHACFIGTGKELKLFLDTLNSDYVYALWDPCNEIFAGVTEPPYPIGFKYIADKVIHVHIKDAIREGAHSLKSGGGVPKCVPVGDGWIDWRGQLKELINRNYTGGVALETHWRINKNLKNQILSLPGGSEFSSSGEESTQICLDRLFSIIQELKI